jgi:exonuclease III
MTEQSIRVSTYNCRSIKSSCDVVRQLCNISDICLIQEHWLADYDLSLLANIHNEFYARGVSAMDTTKLLVGRPFGGVAILWRKSLASVVKVSTYEDSRLMGLELMSGSTKILIICVYLPTETPDNFDEYVSYLGKIHSIVDEAQTSNVYIVGDWNANLLKNSVHGSELINFCAEYEYIISDANLLEPDTYTYVSEAYAGVTSWLDHCVSSVSAHGAIFNMSVSHDFVTSDHLPLLFSINVTDMPECSNSKPSVKQQGTVNWAKVSEEDTQQYTADTDYYLSCISIPTDAMLCTDPHCEVSSHVNDIDELYNCIVNALTNASDNLIKERHGNYKHVPGWNDYVKDLHHIARDAYLLWRDNGKSKTGAVFDNMKRTRAQFKYALRMCQREEQKIRAYAMARKLSDMNYDEFWKDVAKQNARKSPLATTVGGVTGEENIANMFRKHYEGLLTSVTDQRHKSYVDEALCEYSNIPEMCVTRVEIQTIIDNLQCGKSSGCDGLSAEHLKHASHRLSVMLSMCLSAMCVHGHVPQAMLNVVLVPIVKSKTGDVTDQGNYRPIALATVTSKVMERVLLSRASPYLDTSDNQFGFKSGLSTDMCLFAFKEVVNFYVSQGSPVFVCFLDASKAFDRVNHWTLYRKLLDRGVPIFIVRLLQKWYETQLFCIRWGGFTSTCFSVTNGVRQGGVMSPVLFNVYMDDLNKLLADSGVGCNIGGVFINNFSFADDMSLVCPSIAALRKLISICENYAEQHNVVYNANKTVCMCFESGRVKFEMLPPIYLCGEKLNFVQTCTYLGHIIQADRKDNSDIRRQYRALCVRSNMLLRRFAICSNEVKALLFTSYCNNLYCGALWSNYSKADLQSLNVCYNNAYRWLISQPRPYSASLMFVSSGVKSFAALLRTTVFSLMKRVENTNNAVISQIRESTVYIMSKCVEQWNKLLYL